MYIQSLYAGQGKSFSIKVNNGNIIIKTDYGLIKKKVSQGEIVESLEKTKKYIEKFVEGKCYLRKDIKNNRIIQKINYSGGKARRRKNGIYMIYSVKLVNNWLTIYTYTKNSRLYKEVGYYEDSRLKAYEIKNGDKEIKIYQKNGKLWMHLIMTDKIRLSKQHIFYNTCDLYNSHYEIKESNLFYIGKGNRFITIYDENGKIKYQGQYIDANNRGGKWIVKYKEKNYVNGVEIPKKYYYAKAEYLDPKKVLKIRNIELRTYLINKIGLENLIRKLSGKTIDILPDGSQELIAIKVEGAVDNDNQDKVIKILKVKDPSTNIYYCLRVPPNMNDCEKARRWTLYDEQSELNLVKET